MSPKNKVKEKIVHCFIIGLFFALIFFGIFGYFNQARAQPAGRECSANLMLVLDASGSMSGAACTDSQARARDFIDNFMQNPTLQNWAGVVHFGIGPSDNTTLSQELTSDITTIKNGIGRTCKGWSTSTENGIVMATAELEEEGTKPTSTGVPKVMILLTDGQPNSCTTAACDCRTVGDMDCKTGDTCDSITTCPPNASTRAQNAAAVAKAAGIRIFVIGFGSSVNHAFNMSIASDNCPGPHPDAPNCYWRAPTAAQLGPIYDSIFLLIADRDGDGFIDVRCGGNDQNDSQACINPSGREGMICDRGGNCPAVGSSTVIDGQTVWVCSVRQYADTNICVINCGDNFDNNQDGKADVEDPNCPVPSGLALCGRQRDAAETVGKETDPCTLCHLFLTMKRIVDFLVIYFVVPLGIWMLALGGAIMLTAGGAPEKISQGRKILTTALIGVVIFFAAWIIVNTILAFITTGGPPVPGTTGFRIFVTPWNEINCPTGGAPVCP